MTKPVEDRPREIQRRECLTCGSRFEEFRAPKSGRYVTVIGCRKGCGFLLDREGVRVPAESVSRVVIYREVLPDTEPVASGPSEAAIEKATKAIGPSRLLDTRRAFARRLLIAAYAVDESRIRADERQRTLQEVEAWLEAREVGTISDFRREFGNEGGSR